MRTIVSFCMAAALLACSCSEPSPVCIYADSYDYDGVTRHTIVEVKGGDTIRTVWYVRNGEYVEHVKGVAE